MKVHMIAEAETFASPQVFNNNPVNSQPQILIRWGRLDLTMTVDEAQELAESMLERCRAARRPK